MFCNTEFEGGGGRAASILIRQPLHCDLFGVCIKHAVYGVIGMQGKHELFQGGKAYFFFFRWEPRRHVLVNKQKKLCTRCS